MSDLISFRYPRLPAEFSLPKEWWETAGMSGFIPSARAYSTIPASDVSAVSLFDVEPPTRSPLTIKDFRGFDRARLLRILEGFREGAEIAAIPLLENPEFDGFPMAYRYRASDGFHRFHAAVAVGFTYVPAMISRPQVIPWSVE